jgi:cell division protein FtsQ
MPLEFEDPDGDGVLRPTADRFGAPKTPWWRPASKAGRVFLAVCAMLLLAAFTTAGVMLKHSLERDARFRIAGSSNIQATGLSEVSRAEMIPVFGEDIGRNVFFLPLDERRRDLEKIPWIERATVMRVLPDQIRVAVVERQPVAFTRHGQVIGLVDANGVLLSMSAATMAKRHYSFPVVTGIDPGDPADSRKARMALYQRLIAELDADGKHNSEQISEIDLTDPEDARVLMPEQGADILAHFGEDHFLERYQRYKAHIAEWRQQYPHLASVDLRYENQVVLQMASGTETAQTAPASDGGAGAAPAAAGDQSAPVPPVAPDAKGSADQKPGPSGPAAKKPKPAPNKKHAAQKRAALNKSGRNPVLKPHAASASHTTDKNPSSGAAAATQGG